MSAGSRSTILVIIALGTIAGLTVFIVNRCGPGAWRSNARGVIADTRDSLREERKFEPRIMIRQIQGAGTLVVHTVRFEFSDPESKFARRTGEVKASAEIEYAVDVGRMTEADFSGVDRGSSTFTIRLAPPRPHKPRIESVEYGEIKRDGILGYTLGLFSTDQRFKDEAGKAVRAEFDKRLNDAADLAQARKNAQAILNDLYRSTGWKCEIQWEDQP